MDFANIGVAARSPARCMPEPPILGQAPVVYGASQRPPRGDYSRARADYSCDQGYSAYQAADHDTYQRLCARQSALLPGLACQTFIAALPQLGGMERIPRFEDINARLQSATGWTLVGVPGLIPELPFFTLLSERKFPVTTWIRKPDEFDYIVEPDLFHDLFGHVPPDFRTFSDPKLTSPLGSVRVLGIRNCSA